MNTQTLITAAILIAQMVKKPIVSIEFEDGSGVNFNFKVRGSNKWSFINLEKELTCLQSKPDLEPIISKF